MSLVAALLVTVAAFSPKYARILVKQSERRLEFSMEATIDVRMAPSSDELITLIKNAKARIGVDDLSYCIRAVMGLSKKMNKDEAIETLCKFISTATQEQVKAIWDILKKKIEEWEQNPQRKRARSSSARTSTPTVPIISTAPAPTTLPPVQPSDEEIRKKAEEIFKRVESKTGIAEFDARQNIPMRKLIENFINESMKDEDFSMSRKFEKYP